MGELKKMELNRRHKIIAFIVGVILLFLSCLFTWNTRRQDLQAQRSRASEISKTYATELKRDFNLGIGRTVALKQMIKDNDGQVKYFSASAKLLMKDYIDLIAVAPKGEITESYPSGKTASDKFTLNYYSETRKIYEYAEKTGRVAMFGPVKLPLVNQAMVVVDPVYLETGQLWGYIIIAIKVPKIYRHTMAALESLGYDYAIKATASPTVKKLSLVESSLKSSQKLSSPAVYTMKLGSCHFRLEITPKGGWHSSKTIPILAICFIISAILLGLLIALLRITEKDDELHYFAYRDPLTGLYNRRGFLHELNKRLAQVPGDPATAVSLDLDDFKLVNDVYGHDVGDMALIDLADRLRAAFPKDTLISRNGGDEFCAMFFGHSPSYCERLIKRAVVQEKSFKAGDYEIRYTISAGYADWPEQTKKLERLLTLADQALYAAKLSGKNQSKHYQERMNALNRKQLGFTVKKLAEGIPGEFLIYQAGGQEEIIFANNRLIEHTGCRDFEDFVAFTKGSFKGLVHPDDLNKVEFAIKEQALANRGKDCYDSYLEYRVLTKSGIARRMVELGQMAQDDNYGLVYFVFMQEKEALAKPFMA